MGGDIRSWTREAILLGNALSTQKGVGRGGTIAVTRAQPLKGFGKGGGKKKKELQPFSKAEKNSARLGSTRGSSEQKGGGGGGALESGGGREAWACPPP